MVLVSSEYVSLLLLSLGYRTYMSCPVISVEICELLWLQCMSSCVVYCTWRDYMPIRSWYSCQVSMYHNNEFGLCRILEWPSWSMLPGVCVSYLFVNMQKLHILALVKVTSQSGTHTPAWLYKTCAASLPFVSSPSYTWNCSYNSPSYPHICYNIWRQPTFNRPRYPHCMVFKPLVMFLFAYIDQLFYHWTKYK